MKVLVTGSEGLIGTPLCKILEARGDEVVRYDISLGKDVLELPAVLKYVSRADAVIHLAAQSGVEQARAEPYKAWQLNFMGTLNVLSACKAAGGKPVVVASSNHIYGHGDAPVDENGAQLQLDTYSASKHAIDVLARSYAHNYGMPVVVLRNTNCFGPDDPHSDHIVPGTILSLLEGKTPVIKSAGKTIKSYLYVDDVAEAYVAALTWLVAGPNSWKSGTTYGAGTAFNVSGTRLSVLELVNSICGVMAVDSTRPVIPAILGEANDQTDEWLDDSAFRSATGWKPKHTLEVALAKTVAGFRARQESAAL